MYSIDQGLRCFNLRFPSHISYRLTEGHNTILTSKNETSRMLPTAGSDRKCDRLTSGVTWFSPYTWKTSWERFLECDVKYLEYRL